MPMIIGDDNNASIVDAKGKAVGKKTKSLYTPKFFHKSVLTGHGGQSKGLLNENRDPKMYVNGYPTQINPNMEYGTHYNKDIKIYDLPCFIMMPSIWDAISKFDRPNPVEMTKIATKNGDDIWLWMPLHALQIEEVQTPGPAGSTATTTSRNLSACFHMFLFSIKDYAVTEHEAVNSVNRIPMKGNQFYQDIVYNMFTSLRNVESELSNLGYYTDKDALNQFVQQYSLYTELCRAAERWCTQADYYIADVMVKNLNIRTKGKLDHIWTDPTYSAADVLGRLEKYSVPLDQYHSMYQKMAAALPADILTAICRSNLNLKLSNTLSHMDQNRSQLQFCPCNKHIQTKIPYSSEQRAALESTSPLTLVQSGAGTGKSQPLTTPILTPTGWTTMGELRVGDLVIGSDGKSHKVLRIHERGLRSGYHLKFRDGSEVDACNEHLWTIYYKARSGELPKTLTTEEWLNSGYRTHGYLPMVKPVEYEFGEKELPLDPYFLGALIADASLTHHINYRKSDMNVVNAVKKAAINNGFIMLETTEKNATARRWAFHHSDDKPGHISTIRKAIRNMSLEVKSREKFIPEEYKTASIEQRRNLLHGLFDGDGDLRTGRTYARFNTASDQLAEDVLQLLWSLGLAATKQRQKHSRGDYWSVNLLDNSWDPFVASEYAGQAKGSVRPMRRSLVEATPFNPVPMRCIEIDAEDKLYVTKDFIVTHNSTVILGRINHMVANGIDPSDIMVLSFTNAAANHIKDLNPQVHSMTIASMLHTIYNHNHPTHQLSTIQTLVNSLDIFFAKNQANGARNQKWDQFIYDFKHKLQKLDKDNEYTQALNFVEDHLQDVLTALDTVEQTTLELENIICYLCMDTLVEPPETQTKHLIIDEVQDNSVAEFVYSIKYTDKHHCSQYIVGDCSQTLYEFRASNPKALNVLENSGVYETHKLQTNYRSNQEILDFANVLLGTIEANQYANIQLKANSLKPVTLQSFTDAVTIHYERMLNKSTQYRESMLAHSIAVDAKKYIDDKLAKKEQVAILAPTRNNIKIIRKYLEKAYPGKIIASLVPGKPPESDLFSKFIAKYWDTIQYTPPMNILATLRRELMSKLMFITNAYKSAAAQQMQQDIARKTMDAFEQQYQSTIVNWQSQVSMSVMTTAQLLDELKKLMISFEIRRNAIAQTIQSARNAESKAASDIEKADFVMSTIHSAKGLEFDNVIVYYESKSDMEEADKRKYYVALTRAKKTEFIFAYDTLVRPKIVGNYERIVKDLEAKEQAAQAAVAAASGTSGADAGTNPPAADAAPTEPASTTEPAADTTGLDTNDTPSDENNDNTSVKGEAS